MAWMIGLSAALFWMPVVGGLIAGFVGGKKAGGVFPAVGAVLLPGFIFFVVMLLFGGILGGLPLIGQLFQAIAGLGSFVLSFMHVIPLLIGAVIGGWTEERS
jgi:hypothetical protein